MDSFLVGMARPEELLQRYVFDGRRYLAEAYAKKLGKAKVGKSSISFRTLADVDLHVLSELIERAGELTGRGGSP